MADASLPLVYSCSGCSNVAQLANSIALRLDRSGLAEMSCIAGVGGDVRPLVDKAVSGRRILALDGCALHCVANCLSRHGITPDVHVTLTRPGMRKKAHCDCSAEEIDEAFVNVSRLVMTDPRLAATPAEAAR
jgi:uncharacterized metal-binding protein